MARLRRVPATLFREPPVLMRGQRGLRSSGIRLRSVGRLLADAGTEAESSLVHRVRAPVLARLVLARVDGEDDTGPFPAPMMTCSVPGGQRKKSQRLSGRASPSTTGSASPDKTRKASWSVSRWCSPIGTPGKSTRRKTPTCWNSYSPSNSEHAERPSQNQQASRAFRMNHPSAGGASPASVCTSGASGTTGQILRCVPSASDAWDSGGVGRWRDTPGTPGACLRQRSPMTLERPYSSRPSFEGRASKASRPIC